MKDHAHLPVYDDSGINLADPHDRLGIKTEYISLVQEQALALHVGQGRGAALDVGCGYGRMSNALATLGFRMTGVEPSERVLRVAAERNPQHTWVVGKMPDLPFQAQSFDLVCLFNVARVMHLLGIAEACRSLTRLVRPGGRLVVIDNLREGNAQYLPEAWFDQTFARDGLRQVLKVPIRASRWPLIYLIRYGLIPQRWLPRIAAWEVRRMARKRRPPRWSYYNYLFIYEKL